MVLSRGRKATERRSTLLTHGATATGGLVVGAALEFFLDPRTGRRRRHTVRDRTVSRLRRGERRALRRARRAESRALGVARRTLRGRRPAAEPLDDVTLAHKVESQLYRRAGIPKGHLSVNAEDGVVFLRGTMESAADIERLVMVARKIDGVSAVENLLHVPGTPAPAARSKLERNGASG
ncbi:MAG TPA: BON domain-containing protein [Solirubrobacteraceae bacterium]|nr:BON domain-containing protein [Solirubrobacteraceae bacterium]